MRNTIDLNSVFRVLLIVFFFTLTSAPRPRAPHKPLSSLSLELRPPARAPIDNTPRKVEMPFETPRVEASQMEAIRDALAARGLPGGPMVSATSLPCESLVAL